MKILLRSGKPGAPKTLVAADVRRLICSSLENGASSRRLLRAQDSRPQRGSAVFIVLALLAIVAAIVVANTRTLHHLKAELRLIDQEQQKKYEPGARH